MQSLTRLADQIPASPTIAVSDKANQLKAQGKDVVALAGGDPDFDTPAHIIQAGIESMKRGETHYAAPSKGITPLLEAIAEKTKNDNGVDLNPKTDIIVTPGGKLSLYLAIKALLNPGDEVLILEPYWVSYPSMVQLNGGVPISVELSREDNYTIHADTLRKYITPKTKAMIVNSPCNPTGRVITQAEIDAITQVAQEADLYIISDEIYEKLIFDGREHISLASVPELKDRTIIINGMSKAYAMTGWRLGWIAAPTPIAKLAGKFNSQTATCAATFTMHAAVAGLTGPQDVVSEMCNSYRERRDFMVKSLNEIDGVACASIEGAFYLFPTFPGSGKTSMEIANALLDDALIAGVPGNAFGNAGEGSIRFSIATAMTDLEKAVERISKLEWLT